MRGHSLSARLLAASTVLCALLAGCAAVPTGAGTAPSSPAVSAAPPAPTAVPVPVPVAVATPPPVRETVAPVRVVVEGGEIDMTVVPVGTTSDGAMELPADPAVAGWYRYGPGPWDAAGNVVLAAHVDAPDYDIGPLADLQSLAVGTVVDVEGADGAVARYAVDSVTFYPKAQLPIDALFGRNGPRTLVLITCGGEFDSDTGHYDDNVVAVASALP